MQVFVRSDMSGVTGSTDVLVLGLQLTSGKSCVRI